MRLKKLARIVSLEVVLLILVWGCATTIAPKGYLPLPSGLQSEAFGGWLEIKYSLGNETRISRGELIAVHGNNVYLLANTGIISVPVASIQRAELNIFTTQKGMISGWTALGVISTLSHGYFSVFSAPIWLLSGILSAAAESKSGLLLYPEISWKEIAKFARFPQGLPIGLDLQALKPKPLIHQ